MYFTYIGQVYLFPKICLEKIILIDKKLANTLLYIIIYN